MNGVICLAIYTTYFSSLFTSVSYFSENIQTKGILFDRRHGDPLFINSRFVEMTLKELFFSDASFRSQYKFITFNIFLCKTFIISYKILIITMISNETTHGLTIYTKLCQNVT